MLNWFDERFPFRGLCAPASLKLGYKAASEEARIPFRGLCAPASLKLVTRDRQSGIAGAFPGPLCPGLIEAASDQSLSVSVSILSGAFVPRPH